MPDRLGLARAGFANDDVPGQRIHVFAAGSEFLHAHLERTLHGVELGAGVGIADGVGRGIAVLGDGTGQLLGLARRRPFQEEMVGDERQGEEEEADGDDDDEVRVEHGDGADDGHAHHKGEQRLDGSGEVKKGVHEKEGKEREQGCLRRRSRSSRKDGGDHEEKSWRSLGFSPVCLAILASIRGPISSLS